MSTSGSVPTIFEAAASGDIEAVEDAIDPRRLELRRDSNGNTALHFAAKHGHDEIARLLLQYGSSPASKNHKGETALHEAARSNSVDVAIALVSAGASPGAESNESQTCLDVAVAHKSLYTAAYLVGAASIATIWGGLKGALQLGAAEVLEIFEDQIDDILAEGSRGGKFLLVSAFQGDELALRYLLEHGVSLDGLVDHNGATPLHLAASQGYTSVVRCLLDAGADINAKDSMAGGTPLLGAIQGQHLEEVKILLDAGADTGIVLQKGRLRRDLIHIVAQDESPEILQLLLNKGLDPRTLDEAGATAAMGAAGNGHLKTLMALHAAGCDVLAASGDGTTPLLRASLGGHTSVVAWLLDHGADINASDMYGATGLKAAIQNQHVDSVRMLCDRGAEIIIDHLREALGRGNADIVSILVSHGATLATSGKQIGTGSELLQMVVGTANAALARELVKLGQSINGLNQRDKLKFLFDAMRKEYEDCVETFLEQCEDRNLAKEVSLITPIHLAAEVGNVAIFNMLSESGFSIHRRTQYGQTPLHLAALRGRVDIIKELRGSISPENQDRNGNTPLHWASSQGHAAAAKALLDQGASVRARDDYGSTPLHSASGAAHVAVVEVLLEAGASPSLTSLSLSNPLHLAAQTSDEIVQKLLATGQVDVNAVQAQGKTALLLAANQAVAATLLKHGADLSATSSDGLNALCTAAKAGKTELFTYLFTKFDDWLSHEENQVRLWRLVCQGGSAGVFKFLKTTQISLRDLETDDLLSILAEASADPDDYILSSIVEDLIDEGLLQDLNLASRILLVASEGVCVEAVRSLGSLRGIHDTDLIRGLIPLDRAKKGDNKDLIEALIETGASESIGAKAR
ncbi:hypothetical protein ACHAQA_000512 [Verticillium albo-atrum]